MKKALLHLLRTHWQLALLVLIALLLLPAVVAALMAAEDEPQTVAPVPVEETSEPATEPVASPSAEPAVEPPAAPASELASEPPPAPPGEPQPFDEYREMIERPLFSSTRRPPVLRDEPLANLDAQQLREAWRLSGIAMQQGRQLASFSERQGEQRLLLEQGMVLADEWRLEFIGSDHVRLSNGESEVQMPLREPVVAAEADEASAEKDKKQKQKKQKKPAVPKDKTTPPADTPAPAKPAQQG
jgi:outer membrane biosynthesis protein TonB